MPASETGRTLPAGVRLEEDGLLADLAGGRVPDGDDRAGRADRRADHRLGGRAAERPGRLPGRAGAGAGIGHELARGAGAGHHEAVVTALHHAGRPASRPGRWWPSTATACPFGEK